MDTLVQVFTQTVSFRGRPTSVTRVWILTADGRRLPLPGYVFDDRAGLAAYIERRVEEAAEIVNFPAVCPKCGYDVRAASRRCPECGTELETTKRQRRAWLKMLRSPPG